MCILLKLDYAKCSVSDLFFQKLSKKDVWGLDPPVQEGLIAKMLCTPMGLSTPTSNTETDLPKGYCL